MDVYSEWIDACDTVAEKEAIAARTVAPLSFQQRKASASARTGLAPGEKYTAEDEGFIDDADDVDAEAEYADE